MTKSKVEGVYNRFMPKYPKPTVREERRRGRPLKYSRDHYGEVLKLRLKGYSLGRIAEELSIPKSTVYRMLDRIWLGK